MVCVRQHLIRHQFSEGKSFNRAYNGDKCFLVKTFFVFIKSFGVLQRLNCEISSFRSSVYFSICNKLVIIFYITN